MDRIVKAALPEAWLDDLGSKQIVIRGRGGVGKAREGRFVHAMSWRLVKRPPGEAIAMSW